MHFNQDTHIIFDDLANQRFLLNKEVQTSKVYKNSDQFVVTDVELDNISQAIILDVAYNSISFQLIDVLDYYIDDFLRSSNAEPLRIFAYGASEQELNPQGAPQFFKTISQYCDNTHAFITAIQTNKALTTTNTNECYRYNVSLQVYKTQLRIIKNIKELYKMGTEPEISSQIEVLLSTFSVLNEFAQRNCFPLKISSPCNALFHLIQSKTKEYNSLQWISHLDSKEALIEFMDTLNEHIQLSTQKTLPAAHFFHYSSMKDDNEEMPQKQQPSELLFVL
jgi:hypothetical protein